MMLPMILLKRTEGKNKKNRGREENEDGGRKKNGMRKGEKEGRDYGREGGEEEEKRDLHSRRNAQRKVSDADGIETIVKRLDEGKVVSNLMDGQIEELVCKPTKGPTQHDYSWPGEIPYPNGCDQLSNHHEGHPEFGALVDSIQFLHLWMCLQDRTTTREVWFVCRLPQKIVKRSWKCIWCHFFFFFLLLFSKRKAKEKKRPNPGRRIFVLFFLFFLSLLFRKSFELHPH
jgi:hypothetical protein